MHHRMLIEGDPFETRVAVLEDEQLAEIFIERTERRGLVGNLYKGRVTRVLSGMQAAFVDIGLERDAFLYVDDAGPQRGPLPDEIDETESKASAPAAIHDLVQQGEQILVQVVRDPMPQKGARITAQVALPARYLVLLPDVGRRAISRRIENDDERERLRSLVEGLDDRHGLIVRTAAEGQRLPQFAADHRYLVETWAEIEERARKAAAPSIVHQELDPALRVVRDVVGETFEKIVIQGAETYRRVLRFLERVEPQLADRVREWSRPGSLFDEFGLDSQIDAALRSKVWLKSGGYLVIHPTEALVAIDINTGRFVGGADLEETVFKTNLEAAREVVRQIRLRDLGGIIVIDFIDMETASNRKAVSELLLAELAKDRSRSKVLSLSDFGLVELTRKRSRSNLERLLTIECGECRGHGRVKSPTTVCFELRREVLRRRQGLSGGDLLLQVHPSVEDVLRSGKPAVLSDLEQTMGRKIDVRGDAELDREQFEIEVV